MTDPSRAAPPSQEEWRRLQAELDALRESHQLYRNAVDLIGQMVWSASPEGVMLSVSGLHELAGLPPHLSPHQTWLSALHPDDLEELAPSWLQAMASGQPYSAHFRLRMADGSYRAYLGRAAPRRDASGRIVRWYGATEDVHDQVQSEAARKIAEERYRLALRATNDVLWDYDVASGTVEWSDTACEMFGCADPLGITPLSWWEERIHPDDRERTVASFAAAPREALSRWSATYRFRKEDGSYADIFDRGFLIRGRDEEVVRLVGSMSDLTARNRAEAELHRVEGELAQVARLGAMGTMASTLAHEINQPLTAVANYVRGARMMLAAPDGHDPDKLATALQAAEAGAIRAGQIVRRLRELFSSGTVTMQRQDLAWLIEEAGGLAFLDQHLLGISHRVEVDPQARFVRCDRIQIQQVLINLIRNAVQAMERSPVREVVIATRPACGDMIQVLVMDTGPGLGGGEDDIFSQFMTTKAGGMGLGLGLSRTIVEAHGGKIAAQERPEGGACFCFTLPRA